MMRINCSFRPCRVQKEVIWVVFEPTSILPGFWVGGGKIGKLVSPEESGVIFYVAEFFVLWRARVIVFCVHLLSHLLVFSMSMRMFGHQFYLYAIPFAYITAYAPIIVGNYLTYRLSGGAYNNLQPRTQIAELEADGKISYKNVCLEIR